jgi:hypothetical protein
MPLPKRWDMWRHPSQLLLSSRLHRGFMRGVRYGCSGHLQQGGVRNRVEERQLFPACNFATIHARHYATIHAVTLPPYTPSLLPCTCFVHALYILACMHCGVPLICYVSHQCCRIVHILSYFAKLRSEVPLSTCEAMP